MCTRFTQTYACGHYNQTTVSCAGSRMMNGKCPVYKEKEVDNEYDCEDCDEEEEEQPTKTEEVKK